MISYFVGKFCKCKSPNYPKQALLGTWGDTWGDGTTPTSVSAKVQKRVTPHKSNSVLCTVWTFKYGTCEAVFS